ncbi:glutamine synthetase family protein [Roseovarius confluentis]|uniref:glutamine synthetase family protein n=1 Tax=Roseovarius confluentis TaxID=1852027 RepID=UPI000CDD7780|nr:glutamine synthetase family protein [Roseovarius confluentis]
MDLSTYQTFRVAACDLNGRMRGKRVPGDYAGKLDKGAVRMPISALNLDIFGADIEDSPLVFETGDADGILLPTGRGALPLPWLETEQPLVPMAMYHEDGRPFEGDPRHALDAVLTRYAERGWRVVAATELEFTLVDDSDDTLSPVKNPLTGREIGSEEILSMAQLDLFDPFLSELYDACAAMGIPAQTMTSESGVGQFEITLNHQDAMRAADDTWLFKRLIRNLARNHGFAATFMAKPFADDAGNGMHLHFSVWDEDGKNVFDNGGEEGTSLLKQAVAGCIAAMRESTLLFAPHANSYDRLVPGAHAPTGVAWAYENRTAAIRVPGGSPKARRIEHRVAGGDTNPYLTFAGVMGAALTGIEDGLEPPEPITGNAYDLNLLQLCENWESAIDLFETAPILVRVFDPMLIQNLVMTKRQELALFAEMDPAEHWKVYLETV